MPVLATKSNAVIVQDKEQQLEALRNQLHLNKELIERNKAKLCPSQIQQYRVNRNDQKFKSQDLPSTLTATQTMMSRNLRKHNKDKISKFIEKSIVEEESSKYSLFDEDSDGFEYERAMLQEIQRGK